MKYFNRKGFTLIELLIVLSILGVLIALAVPRFAGLASDRKLQVCQGNLRTIDSAIAVYRIEEEKWAPTDIFDIAVNVPAYIQAIPECPGDTTVDHGTYSLVGGAGGQSSQCTITLHTLPSQQ